MATAVQPDETSTFTSLNPANGEVVGEFPAMDASAVHAAVDRAHEAATWWSGLTPKQRRSRLMAWKARLVQGMEELAGLVHRETGKPAEDALLEIILAVVHLDWAAKNAHRVLRSRRVPGGIIAMNMKATVEYQPLGVVGVIGPWNYPVFTPMGSIAYALAAGNAVVFKPSEYTPAVGKWIVDSFADATGGHPVLQLVTGKGATGAALAGADVGKIAFTGSAATAKKVMAACAERLTPIVAECGGKDAFIVDADADLDAAADAAVWGAMSNAGQTCVGVERIYVVEGVYDAFVAKLTAQAEHLSPGDGERASYGPITMPSQLTIIERHIDDALARGATALVGGKGSVRAPYVDPVVLADVPEDSAAVTEETFGPTITVAKVRDADEAVRRANAGSYGLAGTVFAGQARRAREIARRMRSGMTAINSVISFASIPALPFGGVGESGFGRIHGADGLREFTRPKAISALRFTLPGTNLTSFNRGAGDVKRVVGMVRLLHGRGR
ncbi:MAG: aldehyde dehydrogenase family protein [Streptosporangiales bacterium]|nr:aldehyde dehydrogenase family protein [Streptosporangiales bacterium]